MVYWFTIMDALHGILAVFVALLSIAFALAFLIWAIGWCIADTESDEKAMKRLSVVVKRLLVVTALVGVGYILIPSRQSLAKSYLMIKGYQLAESERIDSLLTKTGVFLDSLVSRKIRSENNE